MKLRRIEYDNNWSLSRAFANKALINIFSGGLDEKLASSLNDRNLINIDNYSSMK